VELGTGVPDGEALAEAQWLGVPEWEPEAEKEGARDGLAVAQCEGEALAVCEREDEGELEAQALCVKEPEVLPDPLLESEGESVLEAVPLRVMEGEGEAQGVGVLQAVVVRDKERVLETQALGECEGEALPVLDCEGVAEEQAVPVVLGKGEAVPVVQTVWVRLVEVLREGDTEAEAHMLTVSEGEALEDGVCMGDCDEVPVSEPLGERVGVLEAQSVEELEPLGDRDAEGVSVLQTLREGEPEALRDGVKEAAGDREDDTVPLALGVGVTVAHWLGEALKEAVWDCNGVPEEQTVLECVPDELCEPEVETNCEPVPEALSHWVGEVEGKVLALGRALTELQDEGEGEALAHEDGVPSGADRLGELDVENDCEPVPEALPHCVGEVEGKALTLGEVVTELLGEELSETVAHEEGVRVAQPLAECEGLPLALTETQLVRVPDCERLTVGEVLAEGLREELPH
jgi:hypothetical protein